MMRISQVSTFFLQNYKPDRFFPPSGSIISTTVGQQESELSVKIPFLFSLLSSDKSSTTFVGSSTSSGKRLFFWEN